jgi:hypothetical protein
MIEKKRMSDQRSSQHTAAFYRKVNRASYDF